MNSSKGLPKQNHKQIELHCNQARGNGIVRPSGFQASRSSRSPDPRSSDLPDLQMPQMSRCPDLQDLQIPDFQICQITRSPDFQIPRPPDFFLAKSPQKSENPGN